MPLLVLVFILFVCLFCCGGSFFGENVPQGSMSRSQIWGIWLVRVIVIIIVIIIISIVNMISVITMIIIHHYY